MSIFGSSYPKFAKWGTSVLLEYSKVEITPVQSILEHASIMTQAINKIALGTYIEATITLYLSKYADPMAKYNQVNKYKNDTVTEFYLHSDGQPFCLTDTITPCPFYISEVTPYYLDTTLYWDAIKIKLKSTQYCVQVPHGSV